MINSVIRKKHYFRVTNSPDILNVIKDGSRDIRIKGDNKKLFRKSMRNRYKKLKLEELTMSEEIKTDEELDEEYYDWYCNIVHSQPKELSKEEEYMYQKWYDENELNFRNLKNNGYTDRALMKKAYILGLSVGK